MSKMFTQALTSFPFDLPFHIRMILTLSAVAEYRRPIQSPRIIRSPLVGQFSAARLMPEADQSLKRNNAYM